MSKRTFMTNVTPLVPTISRDVAIALLHDHHAMIELNPLVLRHKDTHPPPNASRDEVERALWYEITDRINYLPGGAVKGEVSYKACFYNLPVGLQTHVFAPAGVDIRSKWSVGGNMPGEPREPVELGLNVPRDVLYIKEEVDLRCNVFMSNFVRRNLKKSHLVVADKILQRAKEMGILVQQSATSAHKQSVGRPAHLHLDTVFSRETSVVHPSPYAPDISPEQEGPIYYSYPPHCACEDERHKRSCTFYDPETFFEAIEQHKQKPFYAISLPSDTSLELDSPSASTLPDQALRRAELYGSSRPNSCLCTGALHDVECISYPGLRITMPKPSASASRTSSDVRHDVSSPLSPFWDTARPQRAERSFWHQADEQRDALITVSPEDTNFLPRQLIPGPLQTREDA